MCLNFIRVGSAQEMSVLHQSYQKGCSDVHLWTIQIGLSFLPRQPCPSQPRSNEQACVQLQDVQPETWPESRGHE